MKKQKLRNRVFTSLVASALVITGLTTQMAAAKTPDVNMGSKYGGNIKVGIFDTFPGFCLNDNPANSALMATRTMYETLFEKTKSGTLVGLLASGASSSADLKTWTVSLRSGITFHDGSAFDANAVLANFNAITGRVAAAAYSAGGLPGLQTKSYTVGTGTAFSSNIKAITVRSQYVLEFSLDRPQNDFTSTLYASGRFFMRSPAQLEDATTCHTKPVGTGPFRIVSWTDNQLVVIRNTSYWRKDPQTNAQLPYLSGITFTNMKENASRSAALRLKTMDAAMFASSTDATFIKDLRKRRTLLNEYKSGVEYYPSLWLNQGKPGSPFKYESARKAVTYCLDRANFLKVRLKGEGKIAKSLVGSQSVMYTKANFPSYSISRSKHFLNEYKAESGNSTLTFTFPSDTSSSSQANARFMKSMWAKCGINANYTVEETGLVLSKAFNAQPSIASGQYYNAYDAIYLLLMEGNDAAFNLPFLLSNAYPGNSTNPVHELFKSGVGAVLGLNHHSDTELDTLLYDAQGAKTRTASRNAYKLALSYMHEHAFMGSLAHVYYSVFTTKRLKGIGQLQIVKGKAQRTVSNWGIDWTGVYKTR